MSAILRPTRGRVYQPFILGAPTLTSRFLRFASACAVVLGTGAAAACSRNLQKVEAAAGPPAVIAELWQEPADLSGRDLFHGAGGPSAAPAHTEFDHVASDTSGWSPGFDVKDAAGIEWSVKTGPEAQSEVVSSRVLWAVGFHQPATYYLPKWSMTGVVSGPQEAGRFRPTLPDHEVVGEWSWYENPFIGTREFGGLIVTNLILNNWDWKTSNNKIYRLSSPQGGVSRWFVVRDLGASLGRTKYPRVLKFLRLRGFGQGTRNNIDDFESQGFITGATAESVEFDYRGIYRDVVESVTPADVQWACSRLARLTDRQWQDAFRAAGYTPELSARFIAKIKEKIAQGLGGLGV
ncbi:MAG: hypothetical protein AB7P34_17280 [Vicinamibacterales bacterium]